jgi:hypothetical protein
MVGLQVFNFWWAKSLNQPIKRIDIVSFIYHKLLLMDDGNVKLHLKN